MPTAKHRVQVTIDEDLSAAMDAIDPRPSSRSKLVRDLALRGARAADEDRRRSEDAREVLLEIADGTRGYDFAAAASAAASRGDRLA